MDNGWLIIHRKLMDKPIWKGSTPEQKVILITLLMMVDFKPNEWEWQGQKYTTKPGEKITSIKTIVEKAGKGISTQNVRGALARFEKLEFLTNKSTKSGRLISILNWDSYQSVQQSNQQSNQQRPNKGPTTNKQGNKETKETSSSEQSTDHKKNDKYKNGCIELKLATYLLNHILKRKPDFKIPDLQRWSIHTDRMIRLDKRNPEKIKSVIEFCQRDDFWQNNILSTSKLREKFDTLELKSTQAPVKQFGAVTEYKPEETKTSAQAYEDLMK